MDNGMAKATIISALIGLVGIAGGWVINSTFSPPPRIVEIRLKDGTSKEVKIDEVNETYGKYLDLKKENNQLQKQLENQKKNLVSLQKVKIQHSKLQGMLDICESKLSVPAKEICQNESTIKVIGENDAPPPSEKSKLVKIAGISFRLLGGERTSQGVLLNWLITSESDAQVKVMRTYARVIDYDGNEYISDAAKIGSTDINYDATFDLVSNIPIKANYHINGVPKSVTKVPLFEIKISDRKKWHIVQFKDIDLLSDG